jgi:DNA-binding NtrC family response regulator
MGTQEIQATIDLMPGDRDPLEDTAVHSGGGGDLSDGDADRYQLIVHVGERFEMHRLPSAGDVLIGRSSGCAVRIDHGSISRRHAVLTIGRPLRIDDCGSQNGTRVAGHPVTPGAGLPVALGDAIEMGAAVLVLQRIAAARPPRRMLSHDYFEARVEEECARRERSGGGFSVVRVSSCETVPPAVAHAALSRALRAHDVLATYAPDEYEILLDTHSETARDVSARILQSLELAGLAVRVGVASYPEDGATAGALIAYANRLVRADELPVESAEVAAANVEAATAMDGVFELVERVAASTISVLILGETGVGKELIAERVHRESPREAGPFLRLNCAALSETLLESELFGHERGAFTGAIAQKRGLLETANGGTVFLDEVGELPLSTQVKLLRVIEERRVTRVGGLASQALDVRFVAATNRDLEADIARGTFRQDLFFRLNGVTIVVPPLRERVEEIVPLATSFVAQACRGRERKPRFTTDAVDLLTSYAWPGNIRELRNVIERAVLLCGDGDITARELPREKMTAPLTARASIFPSSPAPVAPPSSAALPVPSTGEFATASWPTIRDPSAVLADSQRTLKSDIEALERQRILDALEKCVWNQTKAAQMLGVSRGTLIARLDQYGIGRPRKR